MAAAGACNDGPVVLMGKLKGHSADFYTSRSVYSSCLVELRRHWIAVNPTIALTFISLQPVITQRFFVLSHQLDLVCSY